MKCSTCGADNPQNSATCAMCGTSMIPGSQNPFADRLPTAPGYPPAAPGYPPSAPGQPTVAPGYLVPGPAPGFPPPGSAAPNMGVDPGLKLLVPIGTSPVAIAAGYLGLFSFCMPLLGPIAIVVGILALKQSKQNPETAGTARAIIGIVLGVCSTVLLFVILIAIVVGNS